MSFHCAGQPAVSCKFVDAGFWQISREFPLRGATQKSEFKGQISGELPLRGAAQNVALEGYISGELKMLHGTAHASNKDEFTVRMGPPGCCI